MANWFSRSRPQPASWHETWDEGTSRVILHITFDTTLPDNGDSADALSKAILRAIEGVKAREVGSSIPDGVDQATVAIVVEPTHRDLGPLEQHTLDILIERLGSSIPVEVADGAAPPAEDDDPDEDPAVDAPTVEWDEAAQALVAAATLPTTTLDERGARLLKSAFDAGLAAIARDDSQALVPESAKESHRYILRIAVPAGSNYGDRSERKEQALKAALAKTKADLEVTRD